jgi:excisionase family DNA binding protein
MQVTGLAQPITVGLRRRWGATVTIASGPLLTVRQVAECLGLQEGTIRGWLTEGRLPKVCCGRAIRVPAEALKDFVRRNTVPARESM